MNRMSFIEISTIDYNIIYGTTLYVIICLRFWWYINDFFCHKNESIVSLWVSLNNALWFNAKLLCLITNIYILFGCRRDRSMSLSVSLCGENRFFSKTRELCIVFYHEIATNRWVCDFCLFKGSINWNFSDHPLNHT